MLKLRFLGYVYEAKTEKIDQEHWSVCDTFEIITPCSATYYLEVGAPISLKPATKVSWEVKKFGKVSF